MPDQRIVTLAFPMTDSLDSPPLLDERGFLDDDIPCRKCSHNERTGRRNAMLELNNEEC